jgi:hypothetical protein
MWFPDRNELIPVHRTSTPFPKPLFVCNPCPADPEVYTASIPSGIITIKLVPTRTPIPIVDINRSCDEERDMESGNAPARKELDITH